MVRKVKKAKKNQQQARYEMLREHHLAPFEARELSKLAISGNHALKQLVRDRDKRWLRFSKLAITKVDSHRWSAADVIPKWAENLLRMYRTRHWRVQFGPTDYRHRMKKNTPNPWAMFRSYEKVAPKKNYVSPWEVRMVKHGKRLLDTGLVRLQKAKRSGKPVSREHIKEWIAKLDSSIRGASGSRRTQLVVQRDNLRRAL